MVTELYGKKFAKESINHWQTSFAIGIQNFKKQTNIILQAIRLSENRSTSRHHIYA